MKARPKPNYRPALRDKKYEPPRVFKIVEVLGPSDSRFFSEQCVVDVPGTEQKNPGALETSTPTPTPTYEYAIYLPIVLKACSCHAVCSCESVLTPTPTPTLSASPSPTPAPQETLPPEIIYTIGAIAAIIATAAVIIVYIRKQK